MILELFNIFNSYFTAKTCLEEILLQASFILGSVIKNYEILFEL